MSDNVAVSTRGDLVRLIFNVFVLVVSLLVITPAWATLEDFNGKPHQLNEFTGQGNWTVVMFWASDCHVCNAEAEQYIQFHEAHKDKDAKILGISLDGEAKKKDAEAFIKRHAVTFPSLLGDPGEVASMYEKLTGGTWVGTPTFLVYSPTGELKAAQPGAVPPELIEEFIKQQSSQNTK